MRDLLHRQELGGQYAHPPGPGVNMQPSTAAAITRYLSEAKRRYAANTVTHRRPLLYRVARAHDGDLFAVTAEQLDRWLDRAEVTARTRNVYLGSLGSFYRWAIKRGLATSNPAADATRMDAPRALPRPARGADLARAIATASPRMVVWLSLMAYAGLRCCEVAGLEAADLLWHLDPPMIHVCHGTKGNHERLVPLAIAAEQALLEFGLPRAGPLFRRPGSSQSITASYVSRRTNLFLHELGIHATAHQLRHWFGTSFYEESLDLRATQDYMGHASPATTAVYTRFAQGEAAAVVRRLGQP